MSSKTGDYAFGTTPTTHPPAYSSIAHLKETDISFALLLASIEVQDRPKIEKKSAESQETNLYAEIVKDLAKTEEGLKPCTKFECKEVIRKILNSNKRNKEEREDIMIEMDNISSEEKQSEGLLSSLEETMTNLVSEADRLENTKVDIARKLSGLENKTKAYEKEKDELMSKIMVMETEKQRWKSLSQELEVQLSDLMWRGKKSPTTRVSSSSNSKLYIKVDNKLVNDKNRFEGFEKTSYLALVADDILDYSERSICSMAGSTLSIHSMNRFKDSPSKSITSRLSQNIKTESPMSKSARRVLKSSASSSSMYDYKSNDVFSDYDSKFNHSSKSFVDTVSRDRLANINDADLSLNNVDVFSDNRANSSAEKSRYLTINRASSPITTGSRRAASRSNNNNSPLFDGKSLSEFSSLSLNSSYNSKQFQFKNESLLDPIFYTEKARRNWGRDKKVGKIRCVGENEDRTKFVKVKEDNTKDELYNAIRNYSVESEDDNNSAYSQGLKSTVSTNSNSSKALGTVGTKLAGSRKLFTFQSKLY